MILYAITSNARLFARFGIAIAFSILNEGQGKGSRGVHTDIHQTIHHEY